MHTKTYPAPGLRGGDLGKTGVIVPSNIYVEGTEVLLSHQCLENVIANCHSERDREGEKQKIRHQ